jgi:hypothetical protein
MTRDFFFNWTLAVIVTLSNILPNEKIGLSLMNMLCLSSVHITRTACHRIFFFFCTIHKSSVSTGFARQIMPVLRILHYNGNLVTWSAVSLTTAKFKPLINFLRLVSPCPRQRTCSFSWFCMTSACRLHNFVIYCHTYCMLKVVCKSRTGVSTQLTKSKLLYDWQFTANRFVLASSPLRLTTRNTE